VGDTEKKMRKITAILLGTLIASSAALAQTNQVLSKNAVGYIKVSIGGPNSLHLVSNPFVSLDANGDLITNVFGSVANSSSVAVWNESSQSYNTYSKSSRGAWLGTGISTARFSRADGAFIRSGGTATVFFMGEVPDTTTAPTTVQSRVQGITMLGFPYPVEVVLTNSSFGLGLPNGGAISLWNPATTSYNTFSKSTRGAWLGTGISTASIKPGEAIVIRATNATANISTVKPYSWP